MYFASVSLPQDDGILHPYSYLSEGLLLLVAAVPRENLGAGETAEELGGGYLLGRAMMPLSCPDSIPPLSLTLLGHPLLSQCPWRVLGFLSVARVSNPLLHVFHCRLNKAGSQSRFLLVSLLPPKCICFPLDVITQTGVKGTRDRPR